MWQDDEGEMRYVGYDESVACIGTALAKHAPIHGLVGFSQAGLA